nr:hypothetical protein 7 [bacterium]
MKALIDGDVLVYELGFSSETLLDDGQVEPRRWSFVEELIHGRVDLINAEVEATEPPTIFLTTNQFLQKQLNRVRRLEGEEEEREWVPVFRHLVATTRPYKGGRDQPKPFHYNNILAYFLSEFDTVVSEDGLEADDLMCITQTHAEPETTVICSRDKDLRMCPGWHYSWECGRQPSVGPLLVDELGSLEKIVDEKYKDGKVVKTTKWFGTGFRFFCWQMIVGDSTDNIPGLIGKGPVYAYNLLKDLDTKEKLLEAVKREYRDVMKSKWVEYFNEQGALLWMLRDYPTLDKPMFPYYIGE